MRRGPYFLAFGAVSLTTDLASSIAAPLLSKLRTPRAQIEARIAAMPT